MCTSILRPKQGEASHLLSFLDRAHVVRPHEDGGWDIHSERLAGMAEAGALWAASAKFERSTMPR